ncbi:MAG: ASKHA domain-containing protein [Planctomycetota bacterium]
MPVITLLPMKRRLDVPAGSSLRDALAPAGIDFPCGGRGQCKGCRVLVVKGALPVSGADRQRLSEEERSAGWRLACQAHVAGDLVLQVRRWDSIVLEDGGRFDFTAEMDCGIAVDLGTTTVVAQLVDLETGEVIAGRSGLNAQAKFGADIMSRLSHAESAAGREDLRRVVTAQIGAMVTALAGELPEGEALARVVIVGNTVMQHLFFGADTASLARLPFEPVLSGTVTTDAAALGWAGAGNAPVYFLPNLGSFVGSDILGVILATGVARSAELVGAADLGTNGEILVGNRDGILVASTAAGPAFEGARISMGMIAGTGAIDRVWVDAGRLGGSVIGGGAPAGICGSGLVDAVACGLDLGRIDATGAITDGESFPVLPPVTLTGRDIRELQLAKGAIAAGIEILLRQRGVKAPDLARFFLAGAFGNYIGVESARRIGLLKFPAGKIVPVGNAALRGAKMGLFAATARDMEAILPKVRHVPLAEDPAFHEIFMEEMLFPEPPARA